MVAPSLIPLKAGDRIKTDRRDAINLAKLHRAGELTPVWVPDQAHEAVRDLVRARLAAVRSLRQARQQLSRFLLRHGHHYARPAWTLLHRRWLADLRFEQPAHYLVLEDCIAVIEAATARRARPCGGLVQAVATRIASSLPDSLRAAPGRGSSLRAASRLPATKRRLVRCTVELPTETLAIASSPTPQSAAGRIRARLILRAGACRRSAAR